MLLKLTRNEKSFKGQTVSSVSEVETSVRAYHALLDDAKKLYFLIFRYIAGKLLGFKEMRDIRVRENGSAYCTCKAS